MRRLLIACAAGCAAAPAMAETGATATPIVDARLRYESVDQAGAAHKANAITARIRAGATLARGDWTILAEAEGVLAIDGRYNSTVNGRTGFPIVADPETIGLNRLQIQYRGLPRTVVTIGRQRINLDDQRFVGSVGWRQDEQGFDAVRIESGALGPLRADIVYSWSDRTIFGIDSPIRAIAGDTVLAGLGANIGPVTVKGFTYLVDQDAPGRRQFSSQTYGLRATGGFALAAATRIDAIFSHARQSDWAGNPNGYSADYWLGEMGLRIGGFAATAGYEVLGASKGAAFTSFQTPLATLHKFNGWADKFLTTPPNGLRDAYASLAYTVSSVKAVSALVAFHRFDSDRLSIRYGREWNAQIGFKPTRQTAVLLKYADYDAAGFATDTRKAWLQFDYSL